MSSVDAVKVVLLGEAGVGKTSIIHQFTYHQFDPDCISSISAQFISKTIEYQGYGTIKYDIWDTAGQERYRSMAKIFYKDAKVIIFVYDITSEQTFEGMKNYWYEQIKLNCEKDAILAVVANKNDLYNDQKISDEVGQQFADDIGAIFQSTSALSDSGIGKLFDHIGKKLIDPDYNYKDKDNKAKVKFQNKQKIREDVTKNSSPISSLFPMQMLGSEGQTEFVLPGLQLDDENNILLHMYHKAREYEMIQDGDKIAVCISGGKDSNLLAKCFQELKRHGKDNFELEFLCMNPRIQ